LFKKILFSSISGVLLALSFPKTEISLFAWVAFIPLFFIFEANKAKQNISFGFLTGFVFWFITIYWLKYVTWFGLIVLCIYLALYFSLFSFLASLILKSKKSALFLIPAIWVVLEFIRANIFSGFGWALLGYSQYKNIFIIQFADLFGSFAVSFLVMLVNVFIFLLVKGIVLKKAFIPRKQIALVLILFVLVISYAAFKLESKKSNSFYRLGIIQGNIAQDKKWDSTLSGEIFAKYKRLTLKADNDDLDLIIWPETALSFYLNFEENNIDKVKKLMAGFKKPILAGAIVYKHDDFYNSALLFNTRKLERYDKMHLVPFGEYIPFRKRLPILENIVNMVMPIEDFKSGKDYTIFDVGFKFGVLICFEDTLGYLSRNLVKCGAQVLVNITNDAWFMDSSSPYQHLQASVFRAIENRTPLVRCANTGVSCFIDKNGMIGSIVKDKQGKMIFVDGFMSDDVRIDKKQSLTFYNRYPFLFIGFCVLLIIYNFILFSLSYNRRDGHGNKGNKD